MSRAYILDKYGGWKVNIIYYKEWAAKFHSKAKREEYVKRCFSNI
jgi:hypothetical protein